MKPKPKKAKVTCWHCNKTSIVSSRKRVCPKCGVSWQIVPKWMLVGLHR